MENSNNDEEIKERQVDNLINLTEKHTRTTRHLEQYSEIGDSDNRDNAREKQELREKQMESLKDQIVGKKQNETKKEQMQNIVEKYKSTEGYMDNNYENIPDEQLENLKQRQENREIQAENLSENLEEEE